MKNAIKTPYCPHRHRHIVKYVAVDGIFRSTKNDNHSSLPLSASGLRRQKLVTSVFQRQNPLPPGLPFRIGCRRLVTLVLDSTEIRNLVPGIGGGGAGSGAAAAASEEPPRSVLGGSVPAGFLHQAFNCLFFGPALFHRDIWEVGGTVPSAAVDEGDTDPVHAQSPV